MPIEALLPDARIVSVNMDGRHGFTKWPVPLITLVAGQGVKGDAHAGVTVKHRSRVAVDPSQPNLRQVHLIHAELLDELEVGAFASIQAHWAKTSPPEASTFLISRVEPDLK